MQFNPIFCAIDTLDLAQARHLAQNLAPHIGGVKLGLEFFTAHGPEGIRQVAGDLPLFLDMKYHDIPNTVAGAIRAGAGLKPTYITVHASGGSAMLRAAMLGARDAESQTGHRPKILGVSILTSMDAADMQETGVDGSVEHQVLRLAELAQSAGLDGLICSPHEIAALRQQCATNFILVVPGIRPAGSDAGDQKRTLTPREAMDAGATHLVIGRPITQASDPAAAAAAILDSLA